MIKRIILPLVIYAVCCTNSAYALPQYTFTDLGVLGGFYSAAYNINSTGQVVGFSTTEVATEIQTGS